MPVWRLVSAAVKVSLPSLSSAERSLDVPLICMPAGPTAENWMEGVPTRASFASTTNGTLSRAAKVKRWIRRMVFPEIVSGAGVCRDAARKLDGADVPSIHCRGKDRKGRLAAEWRCRFEVYGR